MKMYVFIPIVLVMALLAGCSMSRNQIMDGDGMVNSFSETV